MPGEVTKHTAVKLPEGIEKAMLESLDHPAPRPGRSLRLMQWIQ